MWQRDEMGFYVLWFPEHGLKLNENLLTVSNCLQLNVLLLLQHLNSGLGCSKTGQNSVE